MTSSIDIQDAAIRLQSRVLREGYYVSQYCEALRKHNMSTASIDQHEHTAAALISMANTFWFILPDTKAIRTGPFFDLCDIAQTQLEDLE